MITIHAYMRCLPIVMSVLPSVESNLNSQLSPLVPFRHSQL